ncbi:RNase H domain-containing protein [Abeliophyllum distichum]|uniref:RNase H domain-containing protein n=1 Tax=Abeliophyllum distichum TaxID=126358 RepID=A0ABD1NWU8_9LAMI
MISGWASRLLSFGGRITLIRSVLSSIPLYLLQIMNPPKAILKKLEGIFARFLWDSRNDAPRLHWKRWKDLCIPTVRELFDDTGWNISRLLQLVPHIIAEQIWNIPITAEVHDQIMWKDTSDGRFHTKSAWQLVRTGHTIQAVYVEVVIQRRIGSHMASRCQCCSSIETIQHLFIDSCIANQFVRQGHIRTIVPLLILWFIWTARNDAKYQDISMEPKRIIWKVYHTISLLHTGHLFRVIHWRGDMDITPLFGISLTTSSLPPSALVYWHTPPRGSYKCVRAFFSSYGECPILEAELRAIFDGIILAQRLVLSYLWIESDSTLAIHCITRGGGPWSIQATLRHIRHLLTFDRDTISHIYREGNQTYLPQRVGIVVVISSTALRTCHDVTAA